MIKYDIIRKTLGLFPVLNLSKTIKYNQHYAQNITNFKHFTFPGGEEHIRIDKEHSDLIESADNMLIVGDMVSSSGILKTFLATDAVRSYNPKINISLFAPYFPYARQDRRMISGEPFSVKIMSNLINEQKYNIVEIFDPHSDVTSALINNVNVITNAPFINNVYHSIASKYGDNNCIISPDAGAEKKVYNTISKLQLNTPIVCCTKKRDVVSGKILNSEIPSNSDITGKNCIILDDIIDGGYTFIELAKKLKQNGANKIILAISHGILSNGLDKLKENIDHIYITDSVNSINNDFVTTIPLMDFLTYNDWYCAGKTREPFSTRFL